MPQLKLTNVFKKNAEAYLETVGDERRYKYIINSGGTSSSKTFSTLQLLTQIAINHKKQIDVVGLTVPHLKGGVINDMPAVLAGFDLDFSSMYNVADKKLTFSNGATINFVAIDKVGKAHGGRRDVLYINEANYIHFNIVEQLIIRTRETVFIDFNPTNEFWVHTKLMPENPDKSILIKSTYKDNQYLDKSIVDAIESKRGDGTNNFWRVYGLGELGIAEGLVFDNWEVKDFDKYQFDKYFNGIDWGFSNDPFAFVRCAVDKGTLYICEEIYQKGLLNQDSAPMVKRIVRGESVFCDSAEPKSISEYKSLGIDARPVKKGAGSIESGIKKIQSYDRIVIHTDCKNAQVEFRNYQWKTDKNNEQLPTPVDAFNHLIDAVRYALETEMRYKKKEYDILEDPYEPMRYYGGDGWMA